MSTVNEVGRFQGRRPRSRAGAGLSGREAMLLPMIGRPYARPVRRSHCAAANVARPRPATKLSIVNPARTAVWPAASCRNVGR